MELNQRKSPPQKKAEERCLSLLFKMDQVIIQYLFLRYQILILELKLNLSKNEIKQIKKRIRSNFLFKHHY